MTVSAELKRVMLSLLLPAGGSPWENIFADLIFKISSPDILVCDKK